jgi:hypothetical protein
MTAENVAVTSLFGKKDEGHLGLGCYLVKNATPCSGLLRIACIIILWRAPA